MIIDASYFIVSKSDFISQNLIWAQITFQSNNACMQKKNRQSAQKLGSSRASAEHSNYTGT